MKKISIVFAIVCVICVILSLLLPVLFLREDHGTGIIGGADTSTYAFIYVRRGFALLTAGGVLGLLALAGAAIRRRFGKR